MEKSTKKSFSASYPTAYDILVVALGVALGGIFLAAVNAYVVPKLTAMVKETTS